MSDDWLLGKQTEYLNQYNPELLTPIPRKLTRDELGLPHELPFKGCDIWNLWELSWLNKKGKPVVASGVLSYDCTSPNIVESKSLKLYLNSLNQKTFDDNNRVRETIIKDLSEIIGSTVKLELHSKPVEAPLLVYPKAECIDDIDLEIKSYEYNPEILKDIFDANGEHTKEQLISHLLKTNCRVTNQPDWASIIIDYQGRALNRAALLEYLISFRGSQDFHEPSAERIFMDIMNYAGPESLSVYCRYTRRGGIDINPYRTTKEDWGHLDNSRVWRQ